MPLISIDKLIWGLIYGGMAAAGLGVAVARSDAALGYVLLASGLVGVVAGTLLIVVRSRRRPEADAGRSAPAGSGTEPAAAPRPGDRP